ncbi:DUF4150 domain-containing protein [Massilia violaceinigra]|uniref:DUF4150 domain-containing protein n=1 Tax=Massilia violaceinigra TaxID=2045208 RepID=A0ABY4A6V6_9BURK|nr:DUF4150 domain-containing protein [Massilia violaceinigra]UOD30514.1 DUF4150 domain-containing protein [Massilia violaceinigra]
MNTRVYANGNQISSKAAAGKSRAFPDPCWSPPNGKLLVPYPNFSYAKHLENGSSTVFICGTPVALKDVSYFSTSTGNELATKLFKKGLKSGVIKGKSFFTEWSSNVKFEGLNVCRHNDTMTHNHG